MQSKRCQLDTINGTINHHLFGWFVGDGVVRRDAEVIEVVVLARLVGTLWNILHICFL